VKDEKVVFSILESAGEDAQCHLLFVFLGAGGADGALAWGEAPQRGAQPRVRERNQNKP
jgi:hypothetical protein